MDATLELVGLRRARRRAGRRRSASVPAGWSRSARALVGEPARPAGRRAVLGARPAGGRRRWRRCCARCRRAAGLAVLLVEHDLAMVGRVCRPGAWCWTWAGSSPRAGSTTVMADPAVRRAYLGQVGVSVLALDAGHRRLRPLPSPVRRRLWRSRPARVVALVGPNGAGKSTVARVCAGLVVAERGTARSVAGADLTGVAAVAHRPARGSPRARGPRRLRRPQRRGEPRAVLRAAGSDAGPVGGGARAGLRRVPDAGRAASPARPARSRAASSGCSRWPRCWATRPTVLVADELSLGLVAGRRRRRLRAAGRPARGPAPPSSSSSSRPTGSSAWPTGRSCSTAGEVVYDGPTAGAGPVLDRGARGRRPGPALAVTGSPGAARRRETIVACACTAASPSWTSRGSPR